MMSMFSTLMIAVLVIFPKPEPGGHLAVIGDTQARGHVFLKAIGQINRSPASMVIHVGDQQGYGSWQRFKRFRARALLLWPPIHLVIGNHDFEGVSRRIWLRRWKREKTWKVLSCPPFRCLLLDTATSRPPRGQLPWLRDQLQRPGQVLWFMHRAPPAPRRAWVRSFEKMDPLPYGKRNRPFWRLLERYKGKIRAVFHGHHHAFRAYRLAGVPIWCSGGGGGTLTVSRKRGGFYHWLLVRLEPFSIRVVKIYPRRSGGL